MDATTFVTILGLLAGGGVVFLALSRYDGMFDDRQVFLGFFIGMIGGAFFGFLHSSMDYLVMGDVFSSILILVLLFPVARTMFKVVVLRRPSMEGRFDAVFSGLSLGGGEGAFSVVYILYFLYFIWHPEVSPGAYDYGIMAVIALSYVLASSGAGISCGLYSYTGDRMWVFSAFFIHSSYALVVWVIGMANVLGLLAALPLALVLFMWSYRSIETMMPPEMERAMRRRYRREKR
ncbi:MAG: hypothetical protein J7L61_01950 [Thermoplasmata archaeon]|nr:hypothetical protein [Thermoplasmata archaeon]